MAWVAFDRAVKSVESFDLSGPVDDWRGAARQIHEDICRKAFDADKNSFVQYYGSKGVDAALLLIPQVGFLPPEDARVQGTIAAIERELMEGAWSCATAPKRTSTACRRGRERSWPAASGWPIVMRRAAAMTMPSGCSSICCRCATISACSPRSTIRAPGASSATSRKASRTWPWSTPRIT